MYSPTQNTAPHCIGQFIEWTNLEKPQMKYLTAKLRPK